MSVCLWGAKLFVTIPITFLKTKLGTGAVPLTFFLFQFFLRMKLLFVILAYWMCWYGLLGRLRLTKVVRIIDFFWIPQETEDKNASKTQFSCGIFLTK